MKCDICNKNEVEYRSAMSEKYNNEILYLCNICVIDRFADIQFMINIWRVNT